MEDRVAAADEEDGEGGDGPVLTEEAKKKISVEKVKSTPKFPRRGEGEEVV